MAAIVITAAFVKRVRQAFGRGRSQRQVARLLNVSPSVICLIVRQGRELIASGKKGGRRGEQLRAIAAAYDESQRRRCPHCGQTLLFRAKKAQLSASQARRKMLVRRGIVAAEERQDA